MAARRSPNGNTSMRAESTSKTLDWQTCGPWLLALVANLLISSGAAAQPTTVRKAAPAPKDTRPLGRFIPKENLILYFEFAGLDAHEEAWKKTASYKMLNDTTLGEVLGAVS